MTATHIRYACKRDGVLHDSTICQTPKGALELGRLYCCNTVQDKPDPTTHSDAWKHLIATGRVQVVELYCRETTTQKCEAIK